MALNRAKIGTEYDPATYTVTAEAIAKFVKAYNENNPRYLDAARPGGIVADPMFGMVYTWDAALKPMFDGDLSINLMRLVRGGIEIQPKAAVRPGDVVTTRAKFAGVEEKSSGELMTVETRSVNQRGEEVSVILNHHFIRGDKKADGGAGGKAEAGKAEEWKAPGPELWRATMTVGQNQSVEYADASFDTNPIHTDDNVARMAGFKGIILQGSCTMAFAATHVVDRMLDGDAAGLRRIGVRFAKPVFLGETLTTTAWQVEKGPGKTVIAFEMKNQDGVVVLSQGVAEVAR
ncbi:MAG: MaoC family dehydratase N-terminal domain-containing protein [Deltaproteobacteria bacterium]|nr:MaoC family dehydratase N-terminal domain-containing protein [Deltaproteobacteria bacterium]